MGPYRAPALNLQLSDVTPSLQGGGQVLAHQDNGRSLFTGLFATTRIDAVP